MCTFNICTFNPLFHGRHAKSETMSNVLSLLALDRRNTIQELSALLCDILAVSIHSHQPEAAHSLARAGGRWFDPETLVKTALYPLALMLSPTQAQGTSMTKLLTQSLTQGHQKIIAHLKRDSNCYFPDAPRK